MLSCLNLAALKCLHKSWKSQSGLEKDYHVRFQDFSVPNFFKFSSRLQAIKVLQTLDSLDFLPTALCNTPLLCTLAPTSTQLEKVAAICETKSRFDLEQLFRKKSFFFAKDKSSFGHFDTNRSTVSALFAFRQTAKLTKIHRPTASSFAGFGSKNNYTFENGVFQHLHKFYDCIQASQQSIGLQNTAKKIA